MMMRFLESFDHLNQAQKLTFGFGAIGLLGVIDFLTGYEIAFAVFYVFPIAMLTWNVGKKTGLLASVCSACVWIGADFSSGHAYSHPLIPLWNTIIRLVFFIIIVLLIAELQLTLLREKTWARIDALTGAVNYRLFFELVQLEMDRSHRSGQGFTVAYMDLDNFKAINDQLGHSTGDHVLQSVVSTIKQTLRKIDVIARLGGDEFALLLPETDEMAAKIVLAKVFDQVTNTMKANQWPATLSLGAVTCGDVPASVDELMQVADRLMYKVKQGRKNGMEFYTYRQPMAIATRC